jgi:hypothetical protein
MRLLVGLLHCQVQATHDSKSKGSPVPHESATWGNKPARFRCIERKQENP